MNNQKQVPYRSKFNGYRCCHRNRWLLIAHQKISVQALALLEFYIDISDFDQKHTTYGTFRINYKKIASIFNRSQNTIRNWTKELLELSLISPISTAEEKQMFSVENLERYFAPGIWKGEASNFAKKEKGKPVEIILQSMRTNLQTIEETFQPISKNDESNIENMAIKALGLSKDPSKVVISKSRFTKDDMDWIDEEY